MTVITLISAAGFTFGFFSKPNSWALAERICSAGGCTLQAETIFTCTDPISQDAIILNSCSVVSGANPCQPCKLTMQVTLTACGCNVTTPNTQLCFPDVAGCHNTCSKVFDIVNENIACNSAVTKVATISFGGVVRSSKSWRIGCEQCVVVQ